MVARIEMKLGMYAYYIISIYYIISMTITCFQDDRILFEKAPGNFIKITSSNSLTVACMEVKLGAHVSFPWRPQQHIASGTLL